MIRKQCYTAERKNKHRLITSKHIKKDGTTSKQEFKHDNYIGKPEITHDHEQATTDRTALIYTIRSKGSIIKNKIRVIRRLVKNKNNIISNKLSF